MSFTKENNRSFFLQNEDVADSTSQHQMWQNHWRSLLYTFSASNKDKDTTTYHQNASNSNKTHNRQENHYFPFAHNKNIIKCHAYQLRSLYEGKSSNRFMFSSKSSLSICRRVDFITVCIKCNTSNIRNIGHLVYMEQ